jgi:hypothetical protein
MKNFILFLILLGVILLCGCVADNQQSADNQIADTKYARGDIVDITDEARGNSILIIDYLPVTDEYIFTFYPDDEPDHYYTSAITNVNRDFVIGTNLELANKVAQSIKTSIPTTTAITFRQTTSAPMGYHKFSRGDYFYPYTKSNSNIEIISDYNPQSDTYTIFWTVDSNLNGPYTDVREISRTYADSFEKAGHINLDDQITSITTVPISTATTPQSIPTTPKVTETIPISSNEILFDQDFALHFGITKYGVSPESAITLSPINGPKKVKIFVTTYDAVSKVKVELRINKVIVDRFGNAHEESYDWDYLGVADRFSELNQEVSIPYDCVGKVIISDTSDQYTGYSIGHVRIEWVQ